MDIITHILSGTAAGLAVSAYANASRPKKVVIAGLGALGGFLPDIDAVSRWPGFDGAIGSRFGLAESGEEIFFGKYWYSHHGMTHSAAFAIMLGVCAYAAAYLFGRYVLKSPHNGRLKPLPYGLAACSGVLMHILGDLPTPGGEWGGVRFLWPLDGFYGGWGHVWWWNNYDIMLIMLACVLVLSAVLFPVKDGAFRYRKAAATAVFVVCLAFAGYQCMNRPYGFGPGDASGWSSHEARSDEIQRNILGERLHGVMRRLDAAVRKTGVVI